MMTDQPTYDVKLLTNDDTNNSAPVSLSKESTSLVKNVPKKKFGHIRSYDSSHHRKHSRGMSLETFSSQSLVPLQALAGEGKLEELKSSIDAYDLTLKETDQNGLTLLHHATAHNQVEVMQYLIDSGINLNETDKDGNTALHLAASNECVEAIHLLLDSGAIDTILNKELEAPLHIAALGKNKAFAAILEHPVDCFVSGYRNRTPIHILSQVDNVEGAQLLNQRISQCLTNKQTLKLCSTDSDGLTPMHLAARKNSSRVLEYFINCSTLHGYTVDTVLGFIDEENSTPLHAAVDSGNFEVAEVLLKHGASPIVSRGDLIPPVHLACSQGRIGMVKSMAEKAGYEIFAHTDQRQRTPLHYCALSIHSSCMVPHIVEKAKGIINIDAQDEKGRTPLHNAIISANVSGTKDLLSYGANPLIMDKNGFNALHLAVHRNRKVIVGVLLETLQAAELVSAKCFKGYTPLHLTLCLGHGELISGLMALIDCDLESCSKDDNGDNFLHLASRRGDVKALKSLLEVPGIRKQLNNPNKIGATPLHAAADGGHYRCLNILLNHGAMFHRCYGGETAFNVACRKGYTDCAKLLLQAHPSQLNLTDDNGNSALHAAAQSRAPSMVTLILDEGCKLTVNSDSKNFFGLIIESADVKCAMAVVNHDRWKECLDFYSPSQPCPMIGLIQQMPQVAKLVLDRCHSKAENLDKSHRDYWEEFDFRYLLMNENTGEQQPLPQNLPELVDSDLKPDFDEMIVPTIQYKGSAQRRSVVSSEKKRSWRVQCGKNTMVVLENMMAFKRVSLLTHPVVNAFLSTKWKKYGRQIYFANYLLYLLMVILLSVFVLVVPNPIQVLNSTSSIVNQTTINSTEPQPPEISTGAQVLRVLILLLNGVFVTITVLYFVMSRSKALKSLRSSSTWINILSIFFNIVFLVAPNTLEIWPLGAVACFFSWLALLFALEYFEVVGTIVKMIVAVTKTVLLVLLMCCFMLLAFAFSLYILVGNLSEFSNVGYSFLSVFGFMLGELPYGTYIEEEVAGNLLYGKLFLIFILVLAILLSIVIANLLIGLAIGDIERIKINAILETKSIEILYFSKIDRIIPKQYLNRFLYSTYTHYPNVKKSLFNFIIQGALDWLTDTLETEQTGVQTPPATTDHMKEITELKMHILDLKETVQQLQEANLNHRQRRFSELESTMSLNSFDMDLTNDFSNY